MGKFEVGQKIKVVSEYDTNHSGVIGHVHMVLGEDDFDYEVSFDDGEIELFFEDEIEPASDERAAGDVSSSANVTDPAEQLKWADIAIREANANIVDLQAELAEAESELATLQAQLAAATERAREFEDQVTVHQGTLGIILPWLLKAKGYTVEDGFTEDAIIAMVRNDLEAAGVLNPMYAAKAQADGKGE